jgi:hypothetical protein
VAEPVMVVPLTSPEVSTRTSRVFEAPAPRVPTEQVTFPDPALEQSVPEALMAERS